MATPHNQAKRGEIARTVLMPGDPLRAEYIARKWLQNPRKVNEVRNMYAFTGTYNGKELTVMGSGMGMPSIGIYSYELYKEYGVESVIRTGSAGAYTERLHLFDVVLAKECWSESTYARVQNGDENETQYPDAVLNARIMEAAEERGIAVLPVRVHSSDVFYAEGKSKGYREIYEKTGCECVEMESFALFHNAKALGKRAACLLTISDSFVTGEKTDAVQRQTAFDSMIETALLAAVKMEEQV